MFGRGSLKEKEVCLEEKERVEVLDGSRPLLQRGHIENQSNHFLRLVCSFSVVSLLRSLCLYLFT